MDSSRKEWVDYSKDLNVRSNVDFEQGTIEVAAVVETDQPDALKQAKTKIAGQVRKIFSEEDEVGNRILADQVELPDTKVLVTPENVEQFIEKEVEKEVVKERPFLSGDGKERVKVRVSLNMVPNHVRVRAEKYMPLVKAFSARHQVDASLILAVIHTESFFNPRAKSRCGAYGLMQLIPRHGARAAYEFVYGQDRLVSPSYLYNPKNNIELGAAYLHLLGKQHFQGLSPSKKLYLVLASYNWGPSVVNQKIVQPYQLARLSDQEVYNLLQQKTPKETQNYIRKVTERMRLYAGV